MPFEQVEVPISSPVFRGLDQAELSDINLSLTDGYTSIVGGTNKRPGFSQVVDLGLGVNKRIDGLYWWAAKNKLVVACGGYLFFVSYTNGAYSFTDLSESAHLEVNAPVTFDADDSDVYAANGGSIVHSDGSTETIEMVDADAPTGVTHLALVDGYLIANKDGEYRVYYSNVLAPKTWTADDRFSALGDTDVVNSLIIHNREIYCLGPKTIEIFENDGVSPFSRISGGFIETGCIAPYSVVKTENGLFWLNHNKKFVEFNGRQIKYISSGYDEDIQSFSAVSDCIGSRIEIAGVCFLVFTFPSERRTLVYNYLKEEWSEWSYFNIETQARSEWKGACHAFCPTWNKHIIGDGQNPYLYELSENIYTDNGDLIALERTTGHLDFGSGSEKRSRQLTIRLKRGGGEIYPSTPYLMVRWKDDGKNWSSEKLISLGAPGDTTITKKIHCPGIFTTRQFEFKVTDNIPVTFISARLEIEELRS